VQGSAEELAAIERELGSPGATSSLATPAE
jgi:hypothetical protein